MKTTLKLLAALLLLSTLNSQLSTALAQGTAFTYQGRLNDNGGSASGTYDLRFAVYTAASGGAQAGGTLTNTATAVSNGLFTVTLDFGAGVFNGASYWLQVGVRTNGNSSFTTLTPRQPITPVPYAINAQSLGNQTVFINTNGLVGIGTTNPVYGLHVAQRDGSDGLLVGAPDLVSGASYMLVSVSSLRACLKIHDC